ncbi:MAG: hypothetical protein EPN61_11210 [Burkholderiaceae bacterium]|nr:MAG: hypothetical protein EPN61_11210 [Burkholderiaceae bacterium]
MTGFLDPQAPNSIAEYSRYIDGDLLGKLIAKNFLVNRVGYQSSDVSTPLGRYGDAARKYAIEGGAVHDPADGFVETKIGAVSYEVKCARINIANRYKGESKENWAFVNLSTTPAKKPKSYGVLIAIGITTLGLENERYWEHLHDLLTTLHEARIPARVDALPHEEDFLSLCSFFVLPMSEIRTNYFRVNLNSVEASRYGQYRAWGHDRARCLSVWEAALGKLSRVAQTTALQRTTLDGH